MKNTLNTDLLVNNATGSFLFDKDSNTINYHYIALEAIYNLSKSSYLSNDISILFVYNNGLEESNLYNAMQLFKDTYNVDIADICQFSIVSKDQLNNIRPHLHFTFIIYDLDCVSGECMLNLMKVTYDYFWAFLTTNSIQTKGWYKFAPNLFNESKVKELTHHNCIHQLEEDDEVYTIEEWKELLSTNVVNSDVGLGYWCKLNKDTNKIFESENNVFTTPQLDATHVVWYNK